MATLGKTTTPTSASFGWVLGSGDALNMLFTVPSGGGEFSSVSFWAAGHGTNSVPIYGCIWDSVGNLIAAGGAVTTSGGNSSSPGGDGTWHTSNFASKVFIAGGTQIRIGWWPGNTLSVNWAYNGGDHSPDAQEAAHSGTPGTFSGGATASPTGAVAAYATYTPLSVPTVTSFSPTVGPTGTSVVVNGTGFTFASAVKLNGTPASFTVTPGSDTQLTMTVPAGATTGPITVTNPDGTGTSSSSFIVGSIYGDTGTTFQGGALVYADDGAAWQAGGQAWADTGSGWVQIL